MWTVADARGRAAESATHLGIAWKAPFQGALGQPPSPLVSSPARQASPGAAQQEQRDGGGAAAMSCAKGALLAQLDQARQARREDAGAPPARSTSTVGGTGYLGERGSHPPGQAVFRLMLQPTHAVYFIYTPYT